MKIKIVTDISCGLSFEEANDLGYEMIPIPFIIDGVEYDDTNIDHDEFYEKLKNAKEVHTSQASIDKLIYSFDTLLESNDEILYFPITSGLSSSYATAISIINSEEKYKDRIKVVNHRTISVTQREMLNDVKRLINSGYNATQIKNMIEENAGNISVYISLETLTYLQKGGRLNIVVATVGNLLNIRPILYSDGGKFNMAQKARTLNKAYDMMNDLVSKDIKNKFSNIDKSKLSFGVAYTNCFDKAKEYKENVKKFFNIDNVIIDELPSAVSCHIGSGAIALAVYKKIDEH